MDKQLVLHFMIIKMLQFFLKFSSALWQNTDLLDLVLTKSANLSLEFRLSSLGMPFKIRCSNFGAFVSNFYGAFLRFKFGGFSRLWFNYFSFSLILKGFNNGQVYIET